MNGKRKPRVLLADDEAHIRTLIKALIALPPNVFFRLWFGAVYFYCYVRSEKRDIYRTLLFALRNYRSVLTKG